MGSAVTNTLVVIGVSIIALVLIVVGMYASANNTEVSLRAQFNAQLATNKSSFDKKWKVLAAEAQIPDKYYDQLKQIWMGALEKAAEGGGGNLATSLTLPQNIQVPPDLYTKLMSSVEENYESFHQDQRRLTAIKAEHDAVLARFPSSIFVGGRAPLELKIITSAKTEQAFETGEDNSDPRLFPSKAEVE